MSAERRDPYVLVADDDRDIRELYRACFDTSGYHTAEAGTGSQAIALAVEIVPDVMLTDYMLPDVDGITIARRLKDDSRTAGIRILMVTGYASADLQRRAGAAGVERFLTKPCLPQTAMREVSRLIARPAVRVAPRGTGAFTTPAASRVRNEFAALPGLALTAEQARLVFDLDRGMCDAILDALVAEGFLDRTPYGTFKRPR